MATIIQKKRLANEVKLLSQQPLHYCAAYPDESNPLIWYFLIIGQKGTDYHKGEYIGKIVHSPKYPAEPPDYYMLTPSGRYNVGSKICLTNSSYHKGDWSSTWNILSILIAFYSIWLDDKEHGISHITDTPSNRKRMAAESIEYNKKNNKAIYEKFDRTHLSDDAPVTLMKKKEEKEEKAEKEETKQPEQVVENKQVDNIEPVKQLEKAQQAEEVNADGEDTVKKVKKATKNIIEVIDNGIDNVNKKIIKQEEEIVKLEKNVKKKTK